MEVLVINDGSTDKTQQVIDKAIRDHAPAVRCYAHPRKQNRGVSASRKLGVDNSRGEFIAFLDADDIFLPGKLAHQSRVLEEHPGVVLSHSSARLRHEGISPFQSLSAANLGFAPFKTDTAYNLLDRPDRLTACRICNSTVFARAAELKGAIRSIPQAYQTEDWATSCLLAQRGLFHYTQMPLAVYRRHPNSFTEMNARNKLKQTYAEIELYASLSVLAADEGLRREACQRLHEHTESLRWIYGSANTPKNAQEPDNGITDWTARLIHERDTAKRTLAELNRSLAVRILRRLKMLPAPRG